MMLIKQAYLVSKLKAGSLDVSTLASFHSVQRHIKDWYENMAKKIQIQSRQSEFQDTEKTRIYHHDLHKKFLSKSTILKLETNDREY